MADNLFDRADLNRDQRLDINEFRNLLAQNLGVGANMYTGNVVDEGRYPTGSYETSSTGAYGDINAGIGGYAGLASTNITGIGNTSDNISYSSYEPASYASSIGGITGGFDANVTNDGDGASAAAGGGTSLSTFEGNNTQQQQVSQYAANAQGLYQDPNPQIIRRPAQGGQVTYTQNIKIRFLQPPAIPPPGPLIIKEVRAPQPPPPPPLVVRQRAPPLPTPPPLVLRERPPPIPASAAAQTVIRKLPALPIPPRSVVIERLPALPPKPRDIIIERWVPYGAMTKRKTIIQRAESIKPYPKPRNIIIQYEAPQVRVVRQFQRLGITPENPQEYVQRYGTSLLDAQTLLQQARTAGVVEDISPPTNIGTATAVAGASSSSYNADFVSANSGIETAGAAGSTSAFDSSNYAGQQVGAGFSGYESVQGGSIGGLVSPYEANSFSSQGIAAYSDSNPSGYQNYNISTGSNIDLANAAFKTADLNKDGSLDSNEFRQFISSRNQ
ncbi:unnamed protein product [Rotaria sordida]|uniref:EF-hand domain-containing protein n=1 Tax=Rotaria sordida TaxID=392033 RepID=A0A814NQN8_9BILA|nr:unnamed protein product [Rotaria sordida]CAF1095598.1 unnamed protein product [Rotaria sordida]CAF3767700.1 unnamed protein product [Rotaria sordida]CAF3800091.1 unnamed protein product [Rotaria sordida]